VSGMGEHLRGAGPSGSYFAEVERWCATLGSTSSSRLVWSRTTSTTASPAGTSAGALTASLSSGDVAGRFTTRTANVPSSRRLPRMVPRQQLSSVNSPSSRPSTVTVLPSHSRSAGARSARIASKGSRPCDGWRE